MEKKKKKANQSKKTNLIQQLITALDVWAREKHSLVYLFVPLLPCLQICSLALVIRSACDEAESKASNAASDPQSLSSVRVLNYEVTTDPIKMYQHSHLT